MNRAIRSRLKRLSKTEGMAAVEFAVVLSVFSLMLLGIIEFGYDWYVRHLITNASRDGARYGVIYRAPNKVRVAPVNLPSGEKIEDIVNNELKGLLPNGSWSVNVTGAGYTNPTPGNPLTVTVTANKTWSALSAMMPSLNIYPISVATTMNSE